MINNWIADPDSDVLKLATLLKEITERITAKVFQPFEIEILNETVIEYLDLRKSLYEEHAVLGSAKPKHHYLIHYQEC